MIILQFPSKFSNNMLTHLICMSGIKSIDQSREHTKVWISWPHSFVKAVSGIETFKKSEFSCP